MAEQMLRESLGEDLYKSLRALQSEGATPRERLLIGAVEELAKKCVWFSERLAAEVYYNNKARTPYHVCTTHPTRG